MRSFLLVLSLPFKVVVQFRLWLYRKRFKRETSLQGSTAKTTVVERLTRIDAKTIDYRFTISDPDAYTKSWTAVMPLRVIDGLLFEYACHEANYGMEGVLRGARFREREAAKK